MVGSSYSEGGDSGAATGLLRRVAQDSAGYGFTAAVSRLFSAFLIPVFAFFLSTAEFGLLDVLMTGYIILLLGSGLQVESGVARSYFEAEKDAARPELLWSAVWLYIAGWILVAPLVYPIMGLFAGQGLSLDPMLVFPLVLALLPAQLLGLGLLVLRFQRRLRAYMTLAIGDAATMALMSALLLWRFEAGVASVTWSLVISKVVWGTIAIVWAGIGKPHAWRGRWVAAILHFGLPLVPAVLAQWLQVYATRVLLAVSLPLAIVGTFSLAAQICVVLTVANSAFRNAWFPAVIESIENQGMNEQYARALEIYLFAISALGLVLAALAPSIVALLTPNAFQSASRHVPWIAMSYVWLGLAPILGIGAVAARKTVWNAIAYGCGGSVSILILVMGVDTLGLLAADLGMLVGALISSAVFVVASRMTRGVRFRRAPLAIALFQAMAAPIVFGVFGADDPQLTGVLMRCGIAILFLAMLGIVIRPGQELALMVGAVRSALSSKGVAV